MYQPEILPAPSSSSKSRPSSAVGLVKLCAFTVVAICVAVTASAGVPLGAQMQVNTTFNSDQHRAEVAADAAGNFAVTWLDESTSPARIRARCFYSEGVPFGDEVQINSSDVWVWEPTIDMKEDEEFIVVWSDISIAGQKLSSKGDLNGGQFTVGVENYEYNSSVSQQGGDRFIVVWDDGAGVFGRIFDSAGIFMDGFEAGDTAAWSEVSF